MCYHNCDSGCTIYVDRVENPGQKSAIEIRVRNLDPGRKCRSEIRVRTRTDRSKIMGALYKTDGSR
jgi:hypothetical protein